MAMPNFDKAQKYEFQCDLAHAILALTPAYKNPAVTADFLTKWPPSEERWKQLDKHLKHGLNLLAQLLYETHPKASLPNQKALHKLQEAIEVHNLICVTDAISLCGLLKLGGVECAILKGVSYYLLSDDSYFQSRLSSDIDLLVSRENLAKAIKILEKDGYQINMSPYYRTLEVQSSNYYEYTLIKKLENLKPEVGLHWTLPKGEVKDTPEGPCFEILPETRISEMLRSKKEIHWKGLPASVLSEKDLITNFLLNIDRDFMGQINTIRWIRSAKDFFELSKLFPEISFESCVGDQNERIQKQTAGLHQFSNTVFNEKEAAKNHAAVPNLFYSSLETWVPNKRHAGEVWFALTLSKKQPVLFRILVKIYIMLKQWLGEKRFP